LSDCTGHSAAVFWLWYCLITGPVPS
jgi:hypothetical protein